MLQTLFFLPDVDCFFGKCVWLTRDIAWRTLIEIVGIQIMRFLGGVCAYHSTAFVDSGNICHVHASVC